MLQFRIQNDQVINSGEVDKNWAKEHHGLWAKEVEEESKSKPEPAE